MRLLCNTKTRPVSGVSFGHDDTRLVAGGSGGFDVWDLADSSHTFISSHAVKHLYGCVCDPRGRWAYVSDHLGGFRLLSLEGGEAPPAPGSVFERHVTSFDFTPDGRRLVMTRGGYSCNRVECWEIRPPGLFAPIWSILDGEPINPDEPFLLNQAKWFTDEVAISADGEWVATAEMRSGGPVPLIVMRRGATGEAIAEWGKSAASFQIRLAVAPDKGAVYAWDSRLLERWDAQAGRISHQIPAPGRGHFTGLAIHSSGRFILTVSGDGQARYWDPFDLTPIRAIKCGIGKLHSVAISRDGRMAAAGGDKGRIAFWEVECH